MQKFRLKTPSRRTNAPFKVNYSSYREELREDFFDRCGYCDIPRIETMENYHIDHFAPREKFKASRWSKDINLYGNLVYSCPHCNILKSDTWVTKSFTVSHNGRQGFICPCTKAYDALFKRNKSGEILPQNQLGRYIYNELKMYRLRVSLVWKMDKLSATMLQLKKIDDEALRPLLGELAILYFELLEEFREAKGYKRL